VDWGGSGSVQTDRPGHLKDRTNETLGSGGEKGDPILLVKTAKKKFKIKGGEHTRQVWGGKKGSFVFAGRSETKKVVGAKRYHRELMGTDAKLGGASSSKQEN